MNPCPLCGSATSPKFDSTSDWCTPCATGEIAEQAIELSLHEVFG